MNLDKAEAVANWCLAIFFVQVIIVMGLGIIKVAQILFFSA